MTIRVVVEVEVPATTPPEQMCAAVVREVLAGRCVVEERPAVPRRRRSGSASGP